MPPEFPLGGGCGSLARFSACSRRQRSASAETLQDALVKTYQTNPQLNAERAGSAARTRTCRRRCRAIGRNWSRASASGLQAVRNILPDNTVQSATLKPWTIGLTVTQVLFNGYKTANNVRVAEFQVKSGREALRNIEQGVLLDAVTAYMNVMANYALYEAQRTNVQVLREIQATTKRRLDAGDVTPTDTAQAESRLSRGLADLNAAEVALAISKEIYAQVVGEAPTQLTAASAGRPADPAARRSRRSKRPSHEHPAVLGAGYDVDVAQTSIKLAESALLPQVSVQGSVSRQVQNDPTLSVREGRPGVGRRPDQRADLRRRHGGLANPPGQGGDFAEPAGARTGPQSDAHRRGQRLGLQRRHQDRAPRRGVRGEVRPRSRCRASGARRRVGSAPPSTCSMRSRT